MINKLAAVETTDIGENTIISEFCVIRDNVKIGKNVLIHPNVVINEGVTVGDNVEIFPGALIGKEPKGAGVLAKKIEFKKIVSIGENCSIGPNTIVYYDVRIGENCLIGDGASIREGCVIGSKCIIGRYASLLYNIKIGNQSRIGNLTHITGNVEIGSNVFISNGVCMANDNTFGRDGYKEENVIGAKIKDGVSIGPGVVLLPKITIEEGAIVGAGSVVTKNIEKYSLVMGVPAKHKKYLK